MLSHHDPKVVIFYADVNYEVVIMKRTCWAVIFPATTIVMKSSSSSAWQGKGKISKNMTDRHTYTSSLYIYIISLAGERQNKQKRDRQTYTHFIIIYIYHQLGWGKAK